MRDSKQQTLPRGIFRPAYNRYLGKFGQFHKPPFTYKEFEKNKIESINVGAYTTIGTCSLCNAELSLDIEEPFAGWYKRGQLVCANRIFCKARLRERRMKQEAANAKRKSRSRRS
ncbi:MAG: hypothetical protein JWO13_2730 [Acidobacteriales bacterium]|nr:hypothetical protein [Terriglobales bacterium]